ncbi:hypothetical protein PIB30_058684 [Stylosanthes scabra]|uniref:Putative plant transposon protein domain-containing protein n=1 Tax=Stylosanthes scabra TaxID=79078 RepID=A0ABU6UIT4_9FABA|nr:hypothetical protein [Stylosanthes scabra]
MPRRSQPNPPHSSATHTLKRVYPTLSATNPNISNPTNHIPPQISLGNSSVLQNHQPLCGTIFSFLLWQARTSLEMSSPSDSHDAHYFRSQFHQDLFKEHVASKSVTPEKSFDLQEDQYPEIQEQIANRGWRRLSKPRTKISKVLIQEFYANAVRTKEEIASKEVYPYQSYVRGVTVDFSTEKIKQVLRIRDNTPGVQTSFDTRQRGDQRLDDVIREICVPGARWKMSSSQPDQPIQLTRQDLTHLARGWAEFIIHSIIPTGNKSEVTVARAILIHSIIKGNDVRVEELIVNNIAITVEGVHGRSKLIFPSTVYRLCKEAGVSFREFRGTEFIPVDKPITARVMVRTRGKNINYQQHEEEEDQPEPMQQDENQEEQQDMHFKAPNADFQNTFQEQQQQGFQHLNEQLSNMKLQQMQFFENMQNTQAQYLEELKALKTRQDELWSNQNNFYQRMTTQQGEMAKEIEEIKKFQVNQTLMGFRRDPLDKLEMRMDNQHKEIVEMRAQIKEGTKNSSSREAYCC